MRPVATERIVSRLVIAGLSSAAVTSRPESVTAVFTLSRMASGESARSIVPRGDSSDLDIFAVGSCRSITRAPTFGMAASGSVNVSP